jgi:hypothetical protein
VGEKRFARDLDKEFRDLLGDRPEARGETTS